MGWHFLKRFLPRPLWQIRCRRRMSLTDEGIRRIERAGVRGNRQTKRKRQMHEKMNMNKEIKKYPVYYVHNGQLDEAFLIQSTADYDHYNAQLHHFVPYTDWEKNTKNVQAKTDQKLILMPTVMHQHLENPVYKLPIHKFEKLYGIHPNKLLFDVNSRDENMQREWRNKDMFEDVKDWLMDEVTA